MLSLYESVKDTLHPYRSHSPLLGCIAITSGLRSHHPKAANTASGRTRRTRLVCLYRIADYRSSSSQLITIITSPALPSSTLVTSSSSPQPRHRERHMSKMNIDLPHVAVNPQVVRLCYFGLQWGSVCLSAKVNTTPNHSLLLISKKQHILYIKVSTNL